MMYKAYIAHQIDINRYAINKYKDNSRALQNTDCSYTAMFAFHISNTY